MKTDATVFVVDDDPAMRRSLRWLIESAGLRVQDHESAHQFVAAYDPTMPGCLVLDVRMPQTTGLELQEQLAARHIDVPIVIITGYADVPGAVKAFRAGAVDFIEKPFSDQVLLDSIQKAIDLDGQRRRELAQREEVLARVTLMTPRERQVMEQVVDGASNKQIAIGLGLSEKTVEVHRSRVMAKMRAGSVADLVRLAMTVKRDTPVA